MASEKQIAANRRNALKSTGPRTTEGKARSKLNALRHGFAAQSANLITDGRTEPVAGKVDTNSEINSLKRLHRIRFERTELLRKVAKLSVSANADEMTVALKKIANLARYDARVYNVLKRR